MTFTAFASIAPSDPRSGMSLIELLVVIAIIAVLAMLLLPAVSLVRLASKGVVCQANLRAVGVAMQIYETDREQQTVYIARRDQWNQIYSWDTVLREHIEDGSGHNYSWYTEDKKGEWNRILVCPLDRAPSQNNGVLRRTYAFTGLVGTYADGLRYGMAEAHQGTPYAANWWLPSLPRSRAKSGAILLAERPHGNNMQGADWLTTVRSPKEQQSAHKGLHGPGRFIYLFNDLHTQLMHWHDTWPANQDLTMLDTIAPPQPWSVGFGR